MKARVLAWRPAPDHVDYVVHAVWATISAIATDPLEAGECSQPKAANRSPLAGG